MPKTGRPRRSVLYMPGSNARALEKAAGLSADALILDLEDAVAPAEKEAARGLVAAAVRERRYGRREIAIRVNGLDTEWGATDIAAAVAASPDAILIPKVETGVQLREIAARVDTLGASPSLAIWAMMETPLAALNAAEIAASTPRLSVMVLGTNDLVNELHATHTPERQPVMTALGLCLLAARAHGIGVVDGVYNAFRDDRGLRQSCEQGKALGMDGKTLIHPAQIEIANQVFAPDEAELDEARQYLSAFEAAQAAGEGVTVVNGKIVENLHVENAKRLLGLDAAIRALETAAA
ncbi:MAG: CoA ester lyase [Pseudomonadota bacterium]